MEKKCSKCGLIKSFDCFGKDLKQKDGLNYYCRECVNRCSREYHKSNREVVNKNLLDRYYSIYSVDPDWRMRRNARQRDYNKEYNKRPRTRLLHAEATKRYLSKIGSKISRRLSFQVWYSLRLVLEQSKKKNGRHWQDLVGWSVDDLMKRLELMFKDGMTWDNYGGEKGWQIDHITPRSWFKIVEVGDDEFKKCWSLDNLQPLWLKDNASKGARFSG